MRILEQLKLEWTDADLQAFRYKDRIMTGYSDECTFEKCESVKINYCPMCGREMEVEG